MTKTSKNVEHPPVLKTQRRGLELRGDNRAFFSATEHETVLSGPADTGKTVTCCALAHLISALCPGAQGAVVRKTYASMPGSVLMTFGRTVQNQPVAVVGGERPWKYQYANGSTVWVGGMDRPERVLSSERDFIYVCQAEELAEADWEYLATRCSGRGAVVETPRLFADCNPGGSRHWLKLRAQAGKLRMFQATHKDNPSIYDGYGHVLADGQKRLDVLEALTGVRRYRLKEGLWVTAEGAVFDMFSAVSTNQPKDHVVRKDPKGVKRWFLCQDEGYTNPAAVLLVGDDSDGRRHVFREWYERGKVEADCVEAARWLATHPVLFATHPDLPFDQVAAKSTDEFYQKSEESKVRAEYDAVDDAAASLIAALNAAGVPARGGKGRVLDGVHRVQDRLKVAGDGRPRLTVDPTCVNLVNEFESHVWDTTAGGEAKDKPKDCDNHAIAALRYLEDVQAEPTGAMDSKTASGLVTGTGQWEQRHWPSHRSWSR